MDFETSRSTFSYLKRKAARSQLSPASFQLAEQLVASAGLGAAAEVEAQLVNLFSQAASIEWELLVLGLFYYREACTAVDAASVSGEQIAATLALLVEHQEPRVRHFCADCVKYIAERLAEEEVVVEEGSAKKRKKQKQKQQQFYSSLAPILLSSIRSHFYSRSEQLRSTALGDAPLIPLDDTTGWASLESSLLAYYNLLCGCGAEVAFPILQEAGGAQVDTVKEEEKKEGEMLVDLLITCAAKHQNRFVRRAALDFIHNLCNFLVVEKKSSSTSSNNAKQQEKDENEEQSQAFGKVLKPLFARFASAIAFGLEDNWSELRLAATHASSKFFAALQARDRQHEGGDEEEAGASVWPLLLPRLCMNRFYAVEGVQVAAHSVWREVVGTQGKERLGANAEVAVRYYAAMSKTNNHMIVEAACHALAEVVVKLDRELVITASCDCASLAIFALSECLSNDSWPVRDASCMALGSILRLYSTRATADQLSSFLDTCESNLSDAIPSVRENAAQALLQVVQPPVICEQELLFSICQRIEKYLDIHIGGGGGGDKGSQGALLLLPAPPPPIKSFLSPATLASMTSKAGGGDEGVKVAGIKTQKPGWGCCLDCMVVRKATRFETCEGSVFLLKLYSEAYPVEAERRIEGLQALLTLEETTDNAQVQAVIMEQVKIGNNQTTRICFIITSSYITLPYHTHAHSPLFAQNRNPNTNTTQKILLAFRFECVFWTASRNTSCVQQTWKCR